MVATITNGELNEFQSPLQFSNCFTLCPAMDLVSFQLTKNVLLVYRRGNEKVWDIEPFHSSGSMCIKGLEWKPDGKLFVLFSSDGSIELIDTMTGAVLRELDLGLSNLTCVRWFHKDGESRATHGKGKNVKGILKSLDITTLLPRTGHTQLNTVQDTTNPSRKMSDMDMLFLGTKEGKLSCIFAGIFIVDDIAQKSFVSSKIINIASNTSLTDQYVLVEVGNKIKLFKVSLKCLENDNDFCELLLICTRLLNLSLHFKKSINSIENQYKPYIEYTIRIVQLLGSEIKEDGGTDPDSGICHDAADEKLNIGDSSINPIYDLYDLLLTGSLSKATKKWITDYLGDKGIKRWTKLGRSYFDTARNQIYTEIISSLHLLIVYLTDLSGICRLNPEKSSIKPLDIEECIKMTENYLKYSYKFMIQLNDYQKYFEQTIAWLSSVLSEITTDEKRNTSFATNDITNYLMFLSEKLSFSGDNNEEKVLNDSKLGDFSKITDTVLNKLFDKVKNDIRLHAQADQSIELFCGNYPTARNLKLSICTDTIGHASILLENSKLVIREIHLKDLSGDEFVFSLPCKEPVEYELISPTVLIILLNDSLDIYNISYKSRKLSLQAKYNFSSIDHQEDHVFEGGSMTVNQKRSIICILDSSKRKYLWLNYSI